MNLRKILSLPAKVEIMALHYTYNVGMFFLLLPMLGSETSGSPKGPLLKLWEKGFRAVEWGVSSFQVGQMKVLKKLGLLQDDEFIAKRLRDYLHATSAGKGTPEKRIEKIIGMNNSGFLSDLNTAKLLGEVSHSSDLHFGYDAAKGTFTTFGTATDAEVEKMQKAWDAMQGWALAKAEKVSTLKGEAQSAFAAAVTGVLQGVPIGATENDLLALAPRSGDRNRLLVIFKQAVDGNGHPLAATEIEAKPLPTMADSLTGNPEMQRLKSTRPDHDMVVEAEAFAKYLKDYAARKAAPAV